MSNSDNSKMFLFHDLLLLARAVVRIKRAFSTWRSLRGTLDDPSSTASPKRESSETWASPEPTFSSYQNSIGILRERPTRRERERKFLTRNGCLTGQSANLVQTAARSPKRLFVDGFGSDNFAKRLSPASYRVSSYNFRRTALRWVHSLPADLGENG